MSNVEHPLHYNRHDSGLECMQLVERMSFCLGNAVRHLWRAPHMGNVREDLEKAAFYLQHAMTAQVPQPLMGRMDDELMRLAIRVRDCNNHWSGLTIWSICMGQCGSVSHLRSALTSLNYQLAHPRERDYEQAARLPA